jgi:4-hydroxybenzoate polyprenyltransferase
MTVPADALPRSWVDAAPSAAQPYLRLARFDRPIGTWLLLWPCLWGLALAAPEYGQPWPVLLWYAALFAIGSLAMRGAGCTWNDITDRDIDRKVARTAGRPLAAGTLSLRAALAFLALQGLIGLLVLLQFNGFTVLLGLASLVPVAIYPFMKRITDWPQAVLGLAFNWGALVGWSALAGSLPAAPLLLYLGAALWTVGYDTIYAHQDTDDDAIAGVRSTALKFGARSKALIAACYLGAIFAWAGAIHFGSLGALAYLGLAAAALHLGGQVIRVRTADPASCLEVFRSNRETGAILFAALALGSVGA